MVSIRKSFLKVDSWYLLPLTLSNEHIRMYKRPNNLFWIEVVVMTNCSCSCLKWRLHSGNTESL